MHSQGMPLGSTAGPQGTALLPQLKQTGIHPGLRHAG